VALASQYGRNGYRRITLAAGRLEGSYQTQASRPIVAEGRLLCSIAAGT
jgi:hypothetical protein